MSQTPIDPPDEDDVDDATLTAPNNLDALRDEMIIAVNLYLEALAKVDSENIEDTPRLVPVDWIVCLSGFNENGDVDQFYYRMDASGPPHVQVGMARVLGLALES